MNSPASMLALHDYATTAAEAEAGGSEGQAAGKERLEAVQCAELMREVGLKCMAFNGVCALPPCPKARMCLGPGDAVLCYTTPADIARPRARAPPDPPDDKLPGRLPRRSSSARCGRSVTDTH